MCTLPERTSPIDAVRSPALQSTAAFFVLPPDGAHAVEQSAELANRNVAEKLGLRQKIKIHFDLL